MDNWAKENPTAPGWWWYRDDEYGPAPVYLDWAGFVNDPALRYLTVDECVGEHQELLGEYVDALCGEWCRMEIPEGVE